jgi:transposase-like protein
MTRNNQTIEVVPLSQERRRRWSAEGKAALVRETYEPGMSVSMVARKHRRCQPAVQPAQAGTRRRAHGGDGGRIGGAGQ